jgi:predicted histone-like DNA-binding protein
MAIHIRLIKNNIKSSSSYGKYFAKTVSQGEVTLESMVRESLMARGYDNSAVVAVVTDLEHALKVKLSDGYTVVIPGIGRFSLRVESQGVDKPKQFSLRRHITRIVCGFLPASRRTPDRSILYNFCDGVKAVWQNGFKP